LPLTESLKPSDVVENLTPLMLDITIAKAYATATRQNTNRSMALSGILHCLYTAHTATLIYLAIPM
jgi:hypothetical protein